MQYEGLPFVGHRRLRSFLAHWYDEKGHGYHLLQPEASRGMATEEGGHDEAAFLKDYFHLQEKAFHQLLNFVSEVSLHLNYWLDWTTPVHRRPHWAHQWARKLWRGYLALLGRGEQLAQPERTAARFGRLSEDLCRLLAFIQISSFDLLTSDLGTVEARALALRRCLEGLNWQTRVAAHTAVNLSVRSTKPQMVRRRSFGHSWLGPDNALSEQVAALPGTERGGEAGDEVKELLSLGRDQLRQSDLTLQVLVESVNHFFRESGQLNHWRKWWPVYGMSAFVLLGQSWRFRDATLRRSFGAQLQEVWRQFLHEWIVSPFKQFWEALLLQSPKEELRVQLRDLRAEEEALERMVGGFARFARAEPHFAGTMDGAGDAALPELYFEWSMTNPISNVVTGHLVESCMVQSQKLKVLLYASLYSIDAVMMQLKWDFLMAGVMPTTMLCGFLYWIISSSRRRRQLDSRKKMVRALAELDRFLNRNVASLAPRRHGDPDLATKLPGQGSAVPLKLLLSQALGLEEEALSNQRPSTPTFPTMVGFGSSVDLDKIGAALCHLDTLCRMASQIRLEDADWRSFRRDILDLTSPELSVAEKLHVIATMRHTYHVFDLRL